MNRENTFFGHEKFVCVWNTSKGEFTTEIHGADFFCADNGYFDDDIEKLANLLISESADISGLTQTHYVMRIA
jgi:hypothetical protein